MRVVNPSVFVLLLRFLLLLILSISFARANACVGWVDAWAEHIGRSTSCIQCGTQWYTYRRRHHVNREKEFSLVVDLYSRDSQWWWSAHTASCYRLIRQISGYVCVCVHLFVYVWDCVSRTHYHVKYKMRRRRRLWHFWIDSRRCECVARIHAKTRG